MSGGCRCLGGTLRAGGQGDQEAHRKETGEQRESVAWEDRMAQRDRESVDSSLQPRAPERSVQVLAERGAGKWARA